MPEQPDIVIPVTLRAWQADLLSALIDPDQGLPDLAAVISTILDHVEQGVQRRGAWERQWLCQALGYDWLGNLEPDPEVRHHDRRKQKPHICRHCGAEIIPCQGAHDIPVCKGWKHTQFIASMPIGAHYCEGRSINPSAEPREDKGNA